jgi:cytochrome c6
VSKRTGRCEGVSRWGFWGGRWSFGLVVVTAITRSCDERRGTLCKSTLQSFASRELSLRRHAFGRTMEQTGGIRMRSNKRLITASLLTIITLVTPAAFAGSAEIFKAKCASCHGADGAGQTAVGKSMKIRDLGSAEVQKQSDADLQKVITDGKGKMPAYKAKLSQADISSLVAFIRGVAKK